jgi:uncharacterized membrane protein
MKNVIDYSSIIYFVLFTTGLLFYLYKKNRFSQFKTVKKGFQYFDTHVVVNDQVIDEGDVYKIIDPLRWTVSIYDGLEKYESDLKKFSIPQKYIFAISWYRDEINNGGHDQFYSNSTGIVWEDALNGFKEIGLPEFQKILEESAQRMGGYPSKDRNERQDQLSTQNPDFEDLDKRYYKLEGSSFDSAMLKYIKKNRRNFYFDEVVKKPKAR